MEPDDFAAPHGELVVGAIVAGLDADRQLQHVRQHHRLDVGRAAQAGGGEVHGLRGDEVGPALDGRLGRDDDHARVGRGLADPRHLRQVELDAFLADELVVDEARVERANRQPIGLGRIDRVRADEVACARHVANDERRARQIALHVLGDEAAVGVVAAARRGGDDVGHRLALVEGDAVLRARGGRDRDGRQRGACESDPNGVVLFHYLPFPLLKPSTRS